MFDVNEVTIVGAKMVPFEAKRLPLVASLAPLSHSKAKSAREVSQRDAVGLLMTSVWSPLASKT